MDDQPPPPGFLHPSRSSIPPTEQQAIPTPPNLANLPPWLLKSLLTGPKPLRTIRPTPTTPIPIAQPTSFVLQYQNPLPPSTKKPPVPTLVEPTKTTPVPTVMKPTPTTPTPITLASPLTIPIQPQPKSHCPATRSTERHITKPMTKEEGDAIYVENYVPKGFPKPKPKRARAKKLKIEDESIDSQHSGLQATLDQTSQGKAVDVGAVISDSIHGCTHKPTGRL
ncbi:extensin-like isoform X2 [Cynara cardunculus var. scolymus]|uniref:extensin-like isoform X2 n=1 Tax=Cynara cardunculus var. scolymus TaxID=59895 RepID=UPI000D629CFF|nr:extensin-like isoform X2 [Cynara cardunculus var. scolymus]